MFFFGQTTIGNFTFNKLPLDKQLYARDGKNKGTVIIEGQYSMSGSSNSKKKNNDVGINDRIWLNLTSDKGNFNQILVVFNNGLSDKVDKGYDTKKYSGSCNPTSFYSLIENEKYVIQGEGIFTMNRKVKLGFDIDVAPRIFTVSIDNVEGDLRNSDIYLADNLLKVTHNLSRSDYDFIQTTTGDFPNRFILKFRLDNSSKDNIVRHKAATKNYLVYNAHAGNTTVK